ncbi:gluconolactonase [Stella humosa]|uniref:Gluconolactonase n=1 Tax=Stella humosa TaxID=94 RepID=A0A3N1MJV3_9PROT|nr:SMP-30/gluconolactonase/LRE family protein [Stella humosa]ROQ01276.1 gluconolactonase [Stella humosa]BBK31650.1 gluconolactonase [Stella humosa]
MSLEIRDPRLTAIVGPAVTFETVATGCIFTEGPLWHPAGYLLFSDMPGDHLRRWSQAEGVTTFRQPCNKSNGLAWDRQGRLVACEHATSRVTRTEADGTITVLATHHDGRELNSPNDVVVHGDGGIYFSDPTYGRMEHYGVLREPQLDFRGVFRIDPSGEVRLLADDFGQPNGLCFSQDGRRLFVNDTDRQHIRLFDVRADGTLAGGQVWAETTGEGDGAPDGMKLDSAGNLYCCGPGGIHVFAPDATCLGVVGVPEYTANFAWGDGDYRSLFITASTSVYRIRVDVPGTPQFP